MKMTSFAISLMEKNVILREQKRLSDAQYKTVIHHTPQSVHVVEKLLQDFKSGVKDVEDFWIQMKDKFIYIRYFAVRDEEGKYLGTLEFTQNVAGIRALEGQKRILSE